MELLPNSLFIISATHFVSKVFTALLTYLTYSNRPIINLPYPFHSQRLYDITPGCITGLKPLACILKKRKTLPIYFDFKMM